jgi:aspartyl-tRNA(Asn)/glutamyl-tRNA(Gln) amidotransferase subunit C
LDKKYIEFISALAKLEFDEKNMDKINQRMNMFSDYAKKLAEIDTDNVEPLVNVNETINVLREDEPKPSLDRTIVLSNAPEKMYGCIKVKKIIE